MSDAKMMAELAAEVAEKGYDWKQRAIQLADALTALESANEALAAGRTQAVYLAMLDAGQQDALLALDQARTKARTVLKS